MGRGRPKSERGKRLETAVISIGAALLALFIIIPVIAANLRFLGGAWQFASDFLPGVDTTTGGVEKTSTPPAPSLVVSRAALSTDGGTPILPTDSDIATFYRATSSGPVPGRRCTAIGGVLYPFNGEWVTVEQLASGLAMLELNEFSGRDYLGVGFASNTGVPGVYDQHLCLAGLE